VVSGGGVLRAATAITGADDGTGASGFTGFVTDRAGACSGGGRRSEDRDVSATRTAGRGRSVGARPAGRAFDGLLATTMRRGGESTDRCVSSWPLAATVAALSLAAGDGTMTGAAR
jgi:hypothetical protein